MLLMLKKYVCWNKTEHKITLILNVESSHSPGVQLSEEQTENLPPHTFLYV